MTQLPSFLNNCNPSKGHPHTGHGARGYLMSPKLGTFFFKWKHRGKVRGVSRSLCSLLPWTVRMEGSQIS